MVGELAVGNGAVAAAVRFTTSKVFELFKNKRRDMIWNALALCEYTVDSPELQRDEFISCYLATEEAVFKSTSQAKLNALVTMFVKGVESKKIFEQVDRYQEVLSIVAELTDSELAILVSLYDYEREHGGSLKGNAVKEQLAFLSERCGIPKELMKALLTRLKRTGLVLSGNDMTDMVDLALTGHDAIYLSELANEIKEWVMFVIYDPHTNPLMVERDSL